MCTSVYNDLSQFILPKEGTRTTSLLSGPTPQVVAAQPPRLLDQVAQAARQRGASRPTTTQLVSWVRAFVLFHGKRHPCWGLGCCTAGGDSLFANAPKGVFLE